MLTVVVPREVTAKSHLAEVVAFGEHREQFLRPGRIEGQHLHCTPHDDEEPVRHVSRGIDEIAHSVLLGQELPGQGAEELVVQIPEHGDSSQRFESGRARQSLRLLLEAVLLLPHAVIEAALLEQRGVVAILDDRPACSTTIRSASAATARRCVTETNGAALGDTFQGRVDLGLGLRVQG